MTSGRAPAFEEAFLETFSDEIGVSGGEERVRAAIVERVRDHVDSLEIDAMGSLVARIDPAPGLGSRTARGRERSRPHLMLCAHMDEVGAMIFAIEKDGRLRFRKVGGIDNRILVGQALRIGPDGVRGVVERSRPTWWRAPTARR